MSEKKLTALIGLLLSTSFAEDADTARVDSSSNQTNCKESKIQNTTRLFTGIETSEIFVYGYHGFDSSPAQEAAQVDLAVTGPLIAFTQDFTYTGIGFIDLSAKGVLGVSESNRDTQDYGSVRGAADPLHTRTKMWQVAMRLGGDISFQSLTLPMRLRPFAGFAWSAYNSRVIPADLPGGFNFPLLKLSFYRPSLGLDWFIEGAHSYLKFGFAYEFPWATFQSASTTDGISHFNIIPPKNRVRSSRSGLQATLEGGVALTPRINLFGLAQFYSIFARGRGNTGFGTIGSFQMNKARVQSLMGTFGFDFTY